MPPKESEVARRAREKKEELRKLNYKPPEWTSSRPKPFFDPTIWTDKETVDVLADYTDWHGRHPHQVTPRPLDSVLVLTGKDIQLASPRVQKKFFNTEDDIENIDLTGKPMKKGAEYVTYGNGQKIPPLSPEFTAPRIGERGKFAQVAEVSYKYQDHAVKLARFDSEDPWYKLSVKDTLEIYHMDGDHTSVKTKPPKPRMKSAAVLQFEAEAKWKEEQYKRYQGGGPSMSEEQQRVLEKLAIAVPTAKEKKDIVSPWGDQYKWTEYNAHGTLLDDFNKVDLERRIQYAIQCHEEVLRGDERRKEQARQARLAAKRAALGLSTPAASKPSSAQSKPTASRPATSGQIHPMETVPEVGGEDLVLEDLDNQSYAGSVSSMGNGTYLDLDNHDAGSALGGAAEGGSSVGGSFGGPSLTSGSTYLHKRHGDDISALNLANGSGSSRQGQGQGQGAGPGSTPGSRRPSVDEATLQAALAMAARDGGGGPLGGAGGGGSSSVGANSAGDDLSQMTGAGTFNDTGASGSGGGDASKKPQKTKQQEKLDGILKSKGLSKPDKGGGKNGKGKEALPPQPSPAAPAGAGRAVLRVVASPFAAVAYAVRFLLRRPAPTADTSAADNAASQAADDVQLSDDEEEEERKKKQLTEEDLLDKYDLMKKKLGGDEVLEAQAEAWEKYAAEVRKQTKKQTNMFDTTMDLPDAIEKNNLAKVVFCLAVSGADPNMRANNDEPVLINLIMKILAQDTLTGSLTDDKNETPDRGKMFRVLQALVKFSVDINTREAKNGMPPLHLATAAGNEKVITYLLDNGANINLLSNPPAGDQVGTTALMLAAKFGNIELLAKLIRKGADMYAADSNGRNVLHYAGMFGQTRTAMFLLRCGHDKRLKDNNKQTAGQLSDELGFTVAAQAIMTYAVQSYKAQFALEYFTDKAARDAAPKGMLGDAAAAASAAFNRAGAAFGNAAAASRDALLNFGNFVARLFGCGPPPTEKIDATAAFDMVTQVEEEPAGAGAGVGAGGDDDDE